MAFIFMQQQTAAIFFVIFQEMYPENITEEVFGLPLYFHGFMTYQWGCKSSNTVLKIIAKPSVLRISLEFRVALFEFNVFHITFIN